MFCSSPVRRVDRGQRRAALGQGAGLVDRQGVDLGQLLERLRLLDQDPGPSSAPGGHHDRHRCGQAQGTGTGDDQHRHSVDQGMGQARLRAEPEPGREGEHRHHQHDRHEPGGGTVGQPLDRCPGPLRLGHLAHDLRQQGVGPHPGGPQNERAPAVESAADHPIARRLLDRNRLAGHHRLVHRRASPVDRAVDRYPVTGAHAQQIPDLDRRQRHRSLTVRFEPQGLGGCQCQQLPQRPLGAMAGAW